MTENNMPTVKWRTMESAPKDGTVIDIWMQGKTQHRMVDCYWEEPKDTGAPKYTTKAAYLSIGMTPPSYETDEKAC